MQQLENHGGGGGGGGGGLTRLTWCLQATSFVQQHENRKLGSSFENLLKTICLESFLSSRS